MKMNNFYHHHKVLTVLMIIGAVLLLLGLIVFLFLKLWVPFGGMPSKADRKNYAERTSNFKKGKFVSYEEMSLFTSEKGKNNFLSNKSVKPKEDLPIVYPTFLESPKEEDLTVTWLGHSTIFIQMQGMNILIDPVFSDITSPVSFIGPKRYSDIPIKIDELPEIDIVLITHDHYDHLDYQTIKKIDKKVKRYIVPLGIENHLERWKVSSSKITNMAWNEEINVHGLTIGCMPAKHYSGRKIIDSGNTLWASWVLKNDNYQIYDSGDSGYGSHFEDIYKKYGAFDLVLMDSGQYDQAWANVHMNPEESVTSSKVLHAKVAMPIHWGSFVLANHPWDDPVESFTTYAEKKNLEVITPKIGETVQWNHYENYQEKWWKSIS